MDKIKKILLKVKNFFNSLCKNPETQRSVGVFAAFYYISLGIMLAATTHNIIVFAICAIPALIWLISLVSYFSLKSYASSC